MTGKEIVQKLIPPGAEFLRRARTTVSDLAEFAARVAGEFNRDNGLIRASGMAYSSLLALVPLTVVIFSLISAFGAIDTLVRDIQNALVNILVPTRQEQILDYIRQFTENARTLGLVGFLFFAVTSIMLLLNIENHFNEIWGSRVDKSLVRRITTYTSVLVLGTLLIASSFSVSATLDEVVGSLPQIAWLVRIVRLLFPTLMIFLGFLMMIRLIPSATIDFRSALIGAVAGAILWIAAQRGFAAWANQSVRNSVIYGSLALIPIFLVWLYLVWIIIILALEITFVHQQIRKNASEKYISVESEAERVLLGVSFFFSLARRFDRGEIPLTAHDLSRRLSVSPTEIERIADLFEKRHLIISLEEPHWSYMPARSLNRISLREIFRTLLGDAKPEVFDALANEPRVRGIVGAMSEKALEALDNLTVEDIMDGERNDI